MEESKTSLKVPPNQDKTQNDIIRTVVGDFGRWQLRISLLMALVKLPIAWFQLSIVFLAPSTKFWCKKPEDFHNITDETWRVLMEPNNTNSAKGLNQGHCLIRNVESSNIDNISEDLISCTNGFIYDTSMFLSSITTEWDLVCDKQKFTDLSQIVFMFGVLLGNIILGVLADKYGRKRILVICLFFQSIFGILASFSPFLWLFILLRFLLALTNGGTMVTSFVLCIEIVEGKWRTIIPILYQIPFGLGNSVMSIVAYFLRDWRKFHLTISLLSFLFVSFIWLIPESPRWLLVAGKKNKAFKELIFAAKENKRDMPNFKDTLQNITHNKSCKDNGKLKQLFSTRELSKRTILLCINWAIAGITFFAFTQYMGFIGNNLFLNVALGGFTVLPGTFLCIFLVSNFGRRLTIAYSHAFTALCFFLILPFPKGVYPFDWPRILFAGCGIIGLSVSIPAIYLYTGELIPTALRNTGLGFVMMFSRLTSMLAPLIISLQDVAVFLPLLILGVATAIQVLLVLPLPETEKSRLPDDIKDIESRYGQNEAKDDENGNQYL
ncbi:solute carrier family 22 member 3-like [Sitophilus oryzae]|uniref:Solute carrier family 22 member 3-like n=1 Tax=Sitophilus oryzae TaxID=7048 RepID=A0A6J2Y1S0_SITOR|nr:solute carrier family 22 member 3-like [Sitophilus oryzae]